MGVAGPLHRACRLASATLVAPTEDDDAPPDDEDEIALAQACAVADARGDAETHRPQDPLDGHLDALHLTTRRKAGIDVDLDAESPSTSTSASGSSTCAATSCARRWHWIG